MSRARCEEIMRRYLAEVLMERKLDVIKEIAAEDMWDHTQPKPGREGLEKHAGGFLAARPNINRTNQRLTEDPPVIRNNWQMIIGDCFFTGQESTRNQRKR